MTMTEEGLALIRQYEGFRGTAYQCPAGIWTIGYGHTSQAGPPSVSRGMEMSKETAEALLRSDVETFSKGVARLLRRDITDSEFSALVSFAYNVGLGAFASSSVLKAVNAGDFDAVPRRLQLWVKASGKVAPGLVKRRAAEAQLFAGAGGTSRADTGVPDVVCGKPAFRSTTIVAAIAAALSAAMSGSLGVTGVRGPAVLLFAALGLGAAIWIIRERLAKSREEGI